MILAALRARAGALEQRELGELWLDANQRGRALDGLLLDGLIVGSPESGYLLP